MPPGTESKGTKGRVSPPRGQAGRFPHGLRRLLWRTQHSLGSQKQQLVLVTYLTSPALATWVPEVFKCTVAGDALKTDEEGVSGLGASKELP